MGGGANGTNGAPGVTSLASVTDEPAGTHCVDGGQAIATGIDTNGNGMLEATEVKSTSYVCNQGKPGPTSITGDVTIRNSLDVAALAGVTSISGSLTVIPGTGFTSISLPSLVSVGTLLVSGGQLTSLSAPALTTVSLSLDIEDENPGTISKLDFGALTSVGDLYLRRLAVTDLASFSKLAHVTDGTIDIESSSTLTSVAGLAAAFASGPLDVSLYQNAALTDVSALGGATSLSSLDLENNAVTTLALTSLTQVTGDFYVYESNLASFSAPKLAAVSGGFELDGSQLTTLTLPALTTAQQIRVSNHDKLVSISYPVLKPSQYLEAVSDPVLTTFSAPMTTNQDTYVAGSDLLTMCTFSNITSCASTD